MTGWYIPLAVVLCGWMLLSVWRSYQLYQFMGRLRDIDQAINLKELALGLPPIYSVCRKYSDGSISYLYWRMWIDLDDIADLEILRAQEYAASLTDAMNRLQTTE